MALDLDPIRVRLLGAPKGPWMLEEVKPGFFARLSGIWSMFDLWSTSGGKPRYTFCRAYPCDGEGRRALDLIVNAPEDIAALVEEVEKLRSDLIDSKANYMRLFKAVAEHRYFTGFGASKLDRKLWEVLDD